MATGSKEECQFCYGAPGYYVPWLLKYPHWELFAGIGEVSVQEEYVPVARSPDVRAHVPVPGGCFGSAVHDKVAVPHRPVVGNNQIVSMLLAGILVVDMLIAGEVVHTERAVLAGLVVEPELWAGIFCIWSNTSSDCPL